MMSRSLEWTLLIVICLCLLSPITCERKRNKPDTKPETTSTGASMTGSYYDLLEVTKDADAAEIKKNYRRLALIHHPDKATNDADKEEKQKIFVRLANAYEILSEPRTRTRYDHLVSSGIMEYEFGRDWTQFDIDHGFQPIIDAATRRQHEARERQFRDAYEQFKAAEEVRETYALWGAILGGGLVACVPLIYQWRSNSARDTARRTADNQARSRLRADQEIVKEIQAAREQELAEQAAENRERAAELRALRAQQAEEESEDEEQEDKPEGEDGEEEQEERRTKKKTGGGGSVLKCELCNKKFKSDKQLENHNQSTAHKKLARAAELEAVRAARKK